MVDFEGVLKKMCYSCSCIVVVTGVILFAVSFATIEPNYVGIKYSKNTMTLDTSQLYNNGLYFVGVGHEFILYTTLEQTMQFTVSGRTSDGLSCEAQLTFQYELLSTLDNMLDLYYQFGSGEDYQNIYKKVARTACMDAMSRYTAYRVITDIENLASSMQLEVDKQLEKYHATVSSLQLTEIALPLEYTEAIDETSIAETYIMTASNLMDETQISEDTRVLEAELDAELVLYKANTTATSTLLSANAEANAITLQLEAEAQAYRALYDEAQEYYATRGQNFTKSQLLSYIWIDSMKDTAAGSVMVNSGKPGVLGA